MNTYIVGKSLDESEIIIKLNEDGTTTWIPKDSTNSYYHEYLKWMEANNE